MTFIERIRMRQVLFACLMMFLLFSCAPHNPYTRSYVSERVKKQGGKEIIADKEPGKFDLPKDVDLTDGITEDEAVSLALYNNAQFQADLVALSFAQADLREAGQIPNPLVRYLSPNGGIVAQAYAYFYLDALWQRPMKVAASRRDAWKVAENMVQRSFTLIRDVQVAYADLALAKTKVDILHRNAVIRAEMSALAGSRLRNGDISELEATTAKVDSMSAVDNLMRAAQDTSILRNRFNLLLGFSSLDTAIHLQSTVVPMPTLVSKQEYLDIAYNYHPEITSAKAAIEAAGKRIGWEKSRVLVFTGVLNGQNFALTPSAGEKWPQTWDLGIQSELPIFHQNQGRISRARAELEQAAKNYVALRQRVAMDISDAYARYTLAAQSYQMWNSGVLPSLESAARLSLDSYGSGDASFLPVLEANRQMLDAQLRKAELEAELRRAVSQLNYRIGKSILTP